MTDKKLNANTQSNWTLIRRLFDENGREHISGYIISFVLMGIGAAATSYSVYLLRPIVNGMSASGSNGVRPSFHELRWLAYSVGILFIIRGLATFGFTTILARIGNQIIAKMQSRVFAHLLRQPVQFFQDRHSGEFVTRLASSVNGVRDTLQIVVTTAGRDLLYLVGYLINMLVLDTMMTVIVICVLPVGALLLRRLSTRIRRYARRSYDGSAEVTEIIQETVRGVRIVKSFNLEDMQQSRMDTSVRNIFQASNRVAVSMALASPVGETLGGIAFAAVILYGGWRVSVAGADAGSFFSFIVSLILLYDPAKRLGRSNLEISNGLIGARLIYEILDTPATEGGDLDKPGLTVGRGEVSFKDVAFRYRADEPVLKGASLVAQSGKTTALVGPSGGGKSTIINLLQRFYEPEAGIISIDGVDIRDCTLKSLRQNIAFVSQDVFLFRGTIAENIAYGHPEISRIAIEEAARKANAHDFIMGFSGGYETNVGEQGAQLSGGQRQRIAIARAILKNAPIILLDEPTAALDSKSEREVQKALDDLRKERTTIVVAHRLQTIFNADLICVIEHGVVVERGTHDELLALNGAYHSFFSAQFGASVTPARSNLGKN